MTEMSEETWFSGPVQEAVSLVNQRNCVFLVYIYDISDKSNVLNDVLNDKEITASIHKNAVALKMEKDSENATLFGQFYPLQKIPILYFIKQGTIRDFGNETITKQEVIDKLNQLSLEEQRNFSHQDKSESNESGDAEAKKAELKKSLEEIRKKREEKENNETKQKEIQRRKDAKEMQEAKKIQNDRENQVFMNKIKKERKEQEEHKRKVREEIARDRAEKTAQKNIKKENQIYPSRHDQSSSSKNKDISEFCHLNIRLIDGKTIRNQFKASDSLDTVKIWIHQNRTDSKEDYKLSAQFPTRIFTDSDNGMALRDLDLCPSATIIMKPIYTSEYLSDNGRNNGLLNLAFSSFDYIYALIVGLLNFLSGLLEALFPRHGNYPLSMASEQQRQAQPSVSNLRGGYRLGGSSSDTGKSTAVEEKKQKRPSSIIRINTMHDKSDGENDRKSTYNGNSVNHE